MRPWTGLERGGLLGVGELLGFMAHDSWFSLHIDSQLLTLNCGSVPLRLCPVATCPDDFLLAGCEGGCYCWDVRLDQPQKQR